MFATVFFMLLCAASLSAQKVTTDYNKGTDFSQFKTYYWAKVQAPNDLWSQRIRDMVDQALQSKGWKRLDADGDVALIADVTTQQQQELNTFYNGMGGGWGYRGFGGMGTATTTTSTYHTGTFVLDMFDAKSKQLEWRGVGSDSVAGNADKNTKKLQNTVNKMMKNFPPPPKA
jgi:Domain of unknown function (DUF4136)